MKTVVLNVLLIAVLFVIGCAKGESYVQAGYDFSQLNKVAVVEVAGVVEGDTAKNQIADFFGMELLKKGYTVVERAQVQALLDEQKFQSSDLTRADDAAPGGRAPKRAGGACGQHTDVQRRDEYDGQDGECRRRKHPVDGQRIRPHREIFSNDFRSGCRCRCRCHRRRRG